MLKWAVSIRHVETSAETRQCSTCNFQEYQVILTYQILLDALMKYKEVKWSSEKNELLKKERGIGFELIETLIENEKEIDIIANINYPHQKIFLFEIDEYIVSVPVVETETEIFLKTLFRSRKLNKKYRGHSDEIKN